ncbi:MAG: serine hydrolase [Acidimicrobiales bacterium]
MTDLPTASIPLPAQPAGVSWPTLTWATGPMLTGDPERLDLVLDRAFDVNPNPELASSLAFVAAQGGRIVAERYGPHVTATTALTSWSVAKSITQAAVGLATGDGVIDIDAAPAAPEWTDPADPRHGITLRHLMAMRSGLEFNEDYVDAGTSHCLEMLFGSGAADMAHYAATQELAAPVDTVFNYSSGSTNIVSRAVSQAYGLDRAGTDALLRSRLFGPLGMTSATPHYDGAGTMVGSSYVYATARDFARFGLLYLRDGVWEGRRILPEGWVDQARTARSVDEEDGQFYGAFWWVWGDEHGTFAAQGYEGQLVAVVPALDLVLVRLGKSPIAHRPALFAFYRDVIDAFT